MFTVGQSGNPGTIDTIRICAASQRLDFEFFPSWLGTIGPIEYRLARFPWRPAVGCDEWPGSCR